MLEGLTDGTLALLAQYGYLALFVFIVLETAWITHFVPSEVVIPFAALALVSGSASFAFFVAVLTVGSVVESLVAYTLFGRYGDRLLARYGDRWFVPSEEVDRSKAWFRRWGERLMFWGRLLPVLWTPISVPAGFAAMDRRKFVAYSAPGWAVYMTALGALGYGGADGKAPLDVVVAFVVARTEASPLVLVVTLAGVVAWKGRDRLRG